jgi:hypothetical protein
MADTFVANPGSGGNTFASDDIGSVHYPRHKIAWGADGSATDASVAAPLPVQSVQETSSMTASGTLLTPKFAVISASASGDNVLVASVASKKIRVLSYVIMSEGTVAVTFRQGTTAITGAFPLVINTGISAAYNPLGFFETPVTTALNLNLSAAIGVRGHLTYVEV